MSASRRDFLLGMAATGVLAGCERVGPPWVVPAARRALPDPATCGLDHIVVLCMENRSFDHFLGWVPGAKGKQAHLPYLDDAGGQHVTHHLSGFTGCGFNDPDHSYGGGRVQLNDGACDGFRRGRNDDFALGYYTRDDLPLTRQLVDQFTVCDRWFSSILGPTYPNRLYTHSAATDRVTNALTMCTLPTIWDLLEARAVRATYYYSDLPVLALYGTKYLAGARRLDAFFADAAAGTLPSYAYLDPAFLGGAQNDDHPHADIRRGQNLVGRIVEALVNSPQWGSTLLIITYDEWGGFFDTQVPPRFPDLVDNPGGDVSNPDHAQAGFRVPTLLVSPFSRGGRVARTTFEHSAILKLVEWRFGLPALTPRDAASNNIAQVLDFRHPDPSRPTIVVPTDPGPQPCSPPAARSAGPEPGGDTWAPLAASPLVAAWGVTTP